MSGEDLRKVYGEVNVRRWLWVVVGGGLLTVVDVGLPVSFWSDLSPDLWWLVEDLTGSVVAGSRRICVGWWWLVEDLARSVVAGGGSRRICVGWWWLVREHQLKAVVAGGSRREILELERNIRRVFGLISRRICGGWWRISPNLWWLVEDLAGSVVAGGGSRRICVGWWWLVNGK